MTREEIMNPSSPVTTSRPLPGLFKPFDRHDNDVIHEKNHNSNNIKKQDHDNCNNSSHNHSYDRPTTLKSPLPTITTSHACEHHNHSNHRRVVKDNRYVPIVMSRATPPFKVSSKSF